MSNDKNMMKVTSTYLKNITIDARYLYKMKRIQIYTLCTFQMSYRQCLHIHMKRRYICRMADDMILYLEGSLVGWRKFL